MKAQCEDCRFFLALGSIKKATVERRPTSVLGFDGVPTARQEVGQDPPPIDPPVPYSGECHRFPPSAAVIPISFPLVQNDDWCGEFKPPPASAGQLFDADDTLL